MSQNSLCSFSKIWKGGQYPLLDSYFNADALGSHFSKCLLGSYVNLCSFNKADFDLATSTSLSSSISSSMGWRILADSPEDNLFLVASYQFWTCMLFSKLGTKKCQSLRNTNKCMTGKCYIPEFLNWVLWIFLWLYNHHYELVNS